MKKLEQSQAAKRVNLAEWRASRLHEMDLPSGLHVTVRDVTVTDLVLTGKLPASFVEMADEANKNGANLDLKELIKNGADFGSTLDILASIALVNPQIGMDPDDSHITLKELPGNDKMEIFNFVNREVTALQPFHEGEK